MQYTSSSLESLNHLLRLIHETDEDLAFWEKQENKLMVKQYQHLKKDYCNQFAELIQKFHQKLQLIEVN